MTTIGFGTEPGEPIDERYVFTLAVVRKARSGVSFAQHWSPEHGVQHTTTTPRATTGHEWNTYHEQAWAMVSVLNHIENVTIPRGRPPEQDRQDEYAAMMIARYKEHPGRYTWDEVDEWFENTTGVRRRSIRTYQTWRQRYYERHPK